MPENLSLLLADDDIDDRFFFDMALKGLTIPAKLEMVEDGEKLMSYLSENTGQLPHALFLDLNMPRKNGADCLAEIKQSEHLKHLPVIIYSTSLHEDMADTLYNKGAHYYVRKGSLPELAEMLHKVLVLIKDEKLVRPPRNKFVLSMMKL